MQSSFRWGNFLPLFQIQKPGGETGVKCRVWRGCIFLPVTESLQEKLTVTERLPHDVVVGVWGRGGKGKRGEGENLRNEALQFRS